MSTFGTYVFRQAFSALALILFSLIGVVWIALALKQLKLVTSKGQDFVTLISMTTLGIPKLLAVIAPIALLIAAIHVLNRLNSDSELIVVTASGGTIWTVARPLLFLAFLVALLSAFVNHVGMPWSLRQLRAKITEVRTDLLSQVLLPGRFSSPDPGVVVHIRNRGLDGTLHGLLMHDMRNAKANISYLAEKARVVKTENSAFLAMENGHIIRGPVGIEPQQILKFDNYAVDLDRFERKYSAHIWKPQERYFSELLELDELAQKGGYRIGHFRAELHERFSNVLHPILFVLIAVAFVGQAQSTRQNRNQLIAMAFVFAAVLRGGGLALNNAVVLNPVLFPLMYVLPLGGIGFALVMIVNGARPRPGPSWTDRIEMAAGDLWTGIASRLPRRQPAVAPSASVQPGE